MKLRYLLMVIPAAFLCFSFTQADKKGSDKKASVIAPGAKVEKVVDGLKFGEGPAVDKNGNMYFTDQPNDRIMIWSTDGVLTTWMQPAGRANGLCFDKEGYLWACCDDKGELWRISPDKKVEKIATGYEGKRFNGPNDVWVDKKGGAYFSDPFWVRDYWTDKTKPQANEGVYYLHPDHKTVTRVIDDFVMSNGLQGTPDGKKLFAADYRGGKIWVYTINSDGSLSDKKLFAETGADGLTIDSKGNVYLVSRGVQIYNPHGQKIESIQVPDGVTNVCFGGKDLKTLFITGQKGLYTMKMNVKGNRF
jgi:gluconolactonase